MEVRKVKESDFIKIAELAKKCSPMATERNSIYHLFTKFFSGTSFTVEDNGEMIAFLLGFISQDDPEEAYIHLMCVHPQFRRSGVASTLIGKFLDEVKKRGVRRVSLITKPINNRAISFYRKMGFKDYRGPETFKLGDVNVFRDYNGKGEDMVLFKKSVNG